MANFVIVLKKIANFWRARSRLYQNEILQENMRLTAFFKLYKISIRYSNEYLLAKIGVDTAKNESLEVSGKIFNIIHWCPYRLQ